MSITWFGGIAPFAAPKNPVVRGGREKGRHTQGQRDRNREARSVREAHTELRKRRRETDRERERQRGICRTERAPFRIATPAPSSSMTAEATADMGESTCPHCGRRRRRLLA
jgi:hypothetical protein